MTDCDELEQAVIARWGPSQFDWTIGHTITDDKEQMWFYFCGSALHMSGKMHWAHHGYEKTLSLTLNAMLNPELLEHPCRMIVNGIYCGLPTEPGKFCPEHEALFGMGEEVLTRKGN